MARISSRRATPGFTNIDDPQIIVITAAAPIDLFGLFERSRSDYLARRSTGRIAHARSLRDLRTARQHCCAGPGARRASTSGLFDKHGGKTSLHERAAALIRASLEYLAYPSAASILLIVDDDDSIRIGTLSKVSGRGARAAETQRIARATDSCGCRADSQRAADINEFGRVLKARNTSLLSVSRHKSSNDFRGPPDRTDGR